MDTPINSGGSGGGGSGSTGETDAGEFIDGGSVDWRGLVGTIFGTVVTLMTIWLVELIDLFGRFITAPTSIFFSGLETLIASVFSAATDPVATAAASTESFLGSLGAAAFPVSVAISAGLILILIWGVSRFVR